MAIAIGSGLAIPLPIKISLRWINDVKWPIVNPRHAQGLQETEAQKKKERKKEKKQRLSFLLHLSLKVHRPRTFDNHFIVLWRMKPLERKVDPDEGERGSLWVLTRC